MMQSRVLGGWSRVLRGQMVRWLAVWGVAGLVVVARVQGARPLPPWPYTMPAGGVHGVAWFGSNVSGFENESQMEMLGNYSMVVFGWQTYLNASDFTDELELNVQQAQRVKARHPDSAVLIYIDGLRVQPFYGALKPIMRDPQYQDFFLRNDDGYIPATTYCAQMHVPVDDPRCLCWYWNWFNDSAVDYYLNKLVLPQVQKPGFNGVFFDGSDGFIRGTWQQATNVPPGKTMQDALEAMVQVHKRGAELLYSHQKYAVYSEHLTDSTPEQQAYIFEAMKDTPYFRFYEGYRPTRAYIEEILNETQRTDSPLPVIAHAGGLCNDSGALTDALAAYMIVAGNYSYFMFSKGWFDSGWCWHPEYNAAYGDPLGPATTTVTPTATIYTREYSGSTVTVNCTVADAAATESTVLGDSTRLPFADPPFNCKDFGCTCQGFANYYGTHNGKGFGCAGTAAQAWWKAQHCNANADCACCGGPACSLPGHAKCICPTPPVCTGSIVLKA
eukprot:m.113179 g.113179  ORF g.113179 m.113179 type:complete len:500 (-) comp13010_c0_seq1:102-1601(-)